MSPTVDDEAEDVFSTPATGTPIPSIEVDGNSDIYEYNTPSSRSMVDYMDIDDSSTNQSLFDLTDNVLDFETSKRGNKTTLTLHSIRQSQFVYPLSSYGGNPPPVPKAEELEVVKDFVELINQEHPSGANATFGEDSFVEFELSQFSIYHPDTNGNYPLEMIGLQNLITQIGHSSYCFDGVLSVGGQQRYVQCVPFKLISIGGYGKELDKIEDVWIKSCVNTKSNIYYRLKEPHPHYERYHDGFTWLANLSKHFVDYSLEIAEMHCKVSIHNFRRDFADWLQDEHGQSLSFQKWFKDYNNRDFRTVIATNIDFLAKDAIGTYELEDLAIWAEVKDPTAIPCHKSVKELTIVTPYVYDCFRHMRFGDHLKKVQPSRESDIRRKSQGTALHLTLDAEFVEKESEQQTQEEYRKASSCLVKQSLRIFCSRPLDRKSISVGDVLGVTTDGIGSRWKDEQSKWKEADECWYVYVQGIHTTKTGDRSFDVLWLYKPADTTCAIMKYPHHDELFLSNNCSCESSRIFEDEVLCRVSVAWNGSPGGSDADFFIRQTYLHDNSFVTFKEEHRQCDHFSDSIKTPLQEVVDHYKIGDTVLVEPPNSFKSNHGLEPCEIVGYLQDGSNGLVKVRRLLRRCEIDTDAVVRPNELVYTEEMATISPERVDHKCLVRFYTQREVRNKEVPGPYCRDGTGNIFYITSRLVESGDKQCLQEIDPTNPPPSLIQGFDPTMPPPRRQLRGLDLFCGGGNFGRGLEEGGAIKFTHAVDITKNAVATYYANLEDPESIKFYCGSVDDMLAKAMAGNVEGLPEIPQPGDIDIIAAGSPCVGFSLLNPNKDDSQGKKNQSLIADVAAMIDFYRPKYALLENVLGMAQRGKWRSEDTLSQLICCLVGMGYQLQVFVLDAWSFGSPQSRSRLFVSVAAPGFQLPPHPNLSHSHPESTGDRGLGKLANGLSFGERKFVPTPFEYVTASEATQDLPDIGDGHTYHCTQFPDHRVSKNASSLLRQQMKVIPFNPPGMNFIATWKNKSVTGMTQADYDLFPTINKKNGKPRHTVNPGSRAYGRMKPSALFPTIVTACTPECCREGCALHWSQPRMRTIMEGKRAQGFLDEDVLTGTRREQHRIVGNSVARTVALAEGLSYRAIWLKNPPDEDDDIAKTCVDGQVQRDILSKLWTHRIQAGSMVNSDMSSDELSDVKYLQSLVSLKLTSPAKSDEDNSSMSSATSGTLQNSEPPKGCPDTPKTPSKGPAREKPMANKPLGTPSVRGPGNLWTPETATRKRDITPDREAAEPNSPCPGTGSSTTSIVPKSRFSGAVAKRLGVDVEKIRAERARELVAKERADRERAAAERAAEIQMATERAVREAAARRTSGVREGKKREFRDEPKPVRTPLPSGAPAAQTPNCEPSRPTKRRKSAAAGPGLSTPPRAIGPQAPRHRPSRAPRAPRARPPRPKKPFVVDLTGDSEEEAQARSAKKRVYVMVDNSMFAPYEETYNASLVGVRDPRVVCDGVNGPYSY